MVLSVHARVVEFRNPERPSLLLSPGSLSPGLTPGVVRPGVVGPGLDSLWGRVQGSRFALFGGLPCTVGARGDVERCFQPDSPKRTCHNTSPMFLVAVVVIVIAIVATSVVV